MYLNDFGVKHIKSWITDNSDMSTQNSLAKINELDPYGVALEVNKGTTIEQDLDLNDRYEFWTGFISGQGYEMSIVFERKHFNHEPIEVHDFVLHKT